MILTKGTNTNFVSENEIIITTLLLKVKND